MESPGPPGQSNASWTNAYIVVVCVLALSLFAVSFLLHGPPHRWVAFSVLLVMGIVAWWLPTPSIDGKSRFAVGNIVLLAAIAIVTPFGAGLIAAVMGALERGRVELRRRIFNTAMSSSAALAGGLMYFAVGGSTQIENLRGTGAILRQIGLPIVFADLSHLVVNAVLLTGVIRLSAGVPVLLQLRQMLTSSGPTQFAYGVIAFILIVLWLPGGLGAVAVLVVLAPLVGAWWALLLYGEEREARERALGALVTAIETRAPALEGHSQRVSELSAGLAQEVGLGPHQVGDIRTAGLLHDLGRIVVAPGQEGADARGAAALRGVAMLQTLPFLAGASSIMEEVARPEDTGVRSISAQIVQLADDYDLLIHGGEPLTSTMALARLRAAQSPSVDSERVLGALSRLVRPQGVSRDGSVTTP